MNYDIIKIMERGYGGGWLKLYCEIENEKEEDVIKYLDALDGIEKNYRQNEWSKVLKQIKELRNEFSKEQQREMRRRYLAEKIKRLKKIYFKTKDEGILKQMSSIMKEIKIFTSKNGITKEQILKAREYPITDLVKHRNYMAICPFHNDRNPSMNIRNNFYYCHTCGETGDVIDFLRKTEGISFRETVLKLC